MGDLISRSSVINLLNELRVDNVALNDKRLTEYINELPTAYNVEKVIEELACNSRFIDDINEHNFKCISCVIGQKKAIDIVKRGGVDERT
jgi:hypothetical protein